MDDLCKESRNQKTYKYNSCRKKKLTPKIEKRLRKFIGEINEISESITVSEILPNRKILKKKLGRLVNYKYVYKLPKH